MPYNGHRNQLDKSLNIDEILSVNPYANMCLSLETFMSIIRTG